MLHSQNGRGNRGNSSRGRGANYRNPNEDRYTVSDKVQDSFDTRNFRTDELRANLPSQPLKAHSSEASTGPPNRSRCNKRGTGYRGRPRGASAASTAMGNSQPTENRRTANATCADPTVDFPFLCDNKTVNFIRCSKVMIIFRGLPGSGKSFLANLSLEKYGRNAIVCSADHYLNQGRVYRFNPSKLKEAHSRCQQRASQAASNGNHIIIIDNTNVQYWELEFYVKCANDHDYVILFIEPKTPWKTDLSVLAQVTQHPMEEQTLLRRKKQWETVRPQYYGWFLNNADSLALTRTALLFLDECDNIADFKKQITDQLNFSGDNDLEGYYGLRTVKSLHVTATFLGNVPENATKTYQSLEAVQRAYGAATTMKIIGFVLTPYTLGARVWLTPKQLETWSTNDDERPPPVQVGLGVMRNSTKHQQRPNPISNSTCIPSLKPQANPNAKSKKRFFPSEGLGRRAHITIGHAAGVQAVQTGFDLLQAIDFEREAFRSHKNIATHPLSRGVARKYGEDTWVIYPEQMYTMDAMFSFVPIAK